jgi:hypothetical protein
MSARLKKILLLALATALLVGVSQVQNSLNSDRDTMGLTRVAPLENAPPALAFTTVALGGFRGLIANALWIRASELQDDDKFFEMAQLADWITKLEPHFTQVWIVQGWNMAYNISVKFNDYADRWNWVQRGIELLRDDGLRYNPNDLLIYRELAGFFQHKLGQNMDDANMYYKRAWFDEMSQIFTNQSPNFEELIHPQTDAAKARAQLLREKYKLKPEFMQQVDQAYGPLEWRLPEAHAIYWAMLGLAKAKENPTRVDQENILTLERMIYQSMQLAVVRGRVIAPNGKRALDLAPNLEIIPKANDAYEQAMRNDEPNREHISVGHRNFLRDVVYYLYTYNRETEAAKWFDYLQKNYPKKPLVDGKPNSLPGTLTLDEYAFARVEDEVGSTSRDKTKLVLEGLISTSFYSLAMGDDDRAVGFDHFAQKVLARYRSKTSESGDRISLPPLDEIKKDVLQRLLDPERGFNSQLADQLRTRLNLPAPTNAPPATSP